MGACGELALQSCAPSLHFTSIDPGASCADAAPPETCRMTASIVGNHRGSPCLTESINLGSVQAPIRSRITDTVAQLGFARLLFGREALADIRCLVVWTNLEIRFFAGHRVRALLCPLDRLFDRLHFPGPEARDELLRLGERAIDDGPLRAVEANALAVLTGLQAVTALHDAGLDELLVVT